MYILLNTVDSDCYMLLLDASKAFDLVEYVKLFSDLRECLTLSYCITFTHGYVCESLSTSKIDFFGIG